MISICIYASLIIRIIAIFLIIILSAILSILSMVFNPSGYLSFLLLKSFGKLILFISGVKLYYKGRENINKASVQVFAANHSSYFDVPILYSIMPVQIYWMAKRELFKIPFLGWLMRVNGFIPIDRGQGKKALRSFKAAVEKVCNGARILVFPEGTRSLNGEL